MRGGVATTGRLDTWLRDALLAIEHLLLQELEVLAKDLDRQAIQVDRLATSLVNAMRLLLNLLVLQDDVLLD